MNLPKRYNWTTQEAQLADFWEQEGIYRFDKTSDAPIFAIDTPPPTVSGRLHMGHAYSYTHTDIIARFWRMNGYNVYYPLGFDDNGLPTERLIERTLGQRAHDVGRTAFVKECLVRSAAFEAEYRGLWQRLGLSTDWRYTYRTIDERSQRIAQWSFIDLHRKGLVYRQEAPTLWCPECQTAIAQADVDDLTRPSEFVTLAFSLASGDILPIATTRPELLPACVAIFVHPTDARFNHLVGQHAYVPLFAHPVPILTDPNADPAKGTGAVMCCTFGDGTDVAWWRAYALPLRLIIGPDGRLTSEAGDFAGLSISDARQAMILRLQEQDLILARQPVEQTVRVHERCDTPVETLVTPQWYVRVLDFKEKLLEAGEQIEWRPAHMKSNYRAWVENLAWDWCISRQRFFGVPFPVWYCAGCGATLLAADAQLPVDPLHDAPGPCPSCGDTAFTSEIDVMDTWATSSMSPQIASRWLEDQDLYARLYPMTLRPQAHEIIRTWAFYTIVKSLHHFGTIPWPTTQISGWGLAPAGAGKISKSRGGGPIAPATAVEAYSADAVRYWAASTAPGKDTVISEEKMQAGSKLVTKLWNVARFAERFLEETPAARPEHEPVTLSLADRWLLARTDQLVARATAAFRQYDYATAKYETETFFWTEFADNYLEMAKQRLYDEGNAFHAGARHTLRQVLTTLLKLFAPILPYVTEEIYRGLFADTAGCPSIHRTPWPTAPHAAPDEGLLAVGQQLIAIATAIRRYKSERQMALSAEVAYLYLATSDAQSRQIFATGAEDLKSIGRVQQVDIVATLPPQAETVFTDGALAAGLIP